MTARSFLDKINSKTIKIKQDIFEFELKNNFHDNLKQIRDIKKITQQVLADSIKVSRATFGMYEVKNYPSIENIIALSELLNISIHALATGKKLYFDFQDRPFGETMLLADHYLSLEHQKFITELMENIVTQPASS